MANQGLGEQKSSHSIPWPRSQLLAHFLCLAVGVFVHVELVSVQKLQTGADHFDEVINPRLKEPEAGCWPGKRFHGSLGWRDERAAQTLFGVWEKLDVECGSSGTAVRVRRNWNWISA